MYCKVCMNDISHEDVFCSDKNCRFVRLYIKKNGIKKLKELIEREIKQKPLQHRP